MPEHTNLYNATNRYAINTSRRQYKSRQDRLRCILFVNMALNLRNLKGACRLWPYKIASKLKRLFYLGWEGTVSYIFIVKSLMHK